MLELAIGVVPLDEIREIFGYANLQDILSYRIIGDKLRVDNIILLLLVLGVEHFEGLSTKELIVSIKDHEDLIVVTIFMDSIINILQGRSVRFTTNQYKFLRVSIAPFEIDCCRLGSFIL
jgi:hypothetical protein